MRNGGCDLAPPSVADGNAASVCALNQCAYHIGQAALAWPNGIRSVRFGIKPHDNIVHEYATVRQHKTRTKHGKQSLGYGNNAAVQIDNVETGRAA